MGKEPHLSCGAKQECKTSKARLKLRARGERYFLEATVINIRIFSVFENFVLIHLQNTLWERGFLPRRPSKANRA